MFGKVVTNVDFKVCCSVDVQLHILYSSCKKKVLESSLGSLLLQCLDQLRKMHLANLSESFVDDLVELSWAQSHCRKNNSNRQQRLLSIKLPFFFLIFVGASPCSVVETCLHMLFLINCICSVIVDIKAADLLVVESI